MFCLCHQITSVEVYGKIVNFKNSSEYSFIILDNFGLNSGEIVGINIDKNGKFGFELVWVKNNKPDKLILVKDGEYDVVLKIFLTITKKELSLKNESNGKTYNAKRRARYYILENLEI